TQNPDTSTTCSKCGFNLKGAAAPKFKGTMLMMNAPPGIPRAAGAPPAGPAPGAPPAMPRAAGAPGAGPAHGVKPQLKGTMLGVAPPPPGGAPQPSDAGMPPPPPAPVAAAPVAAAG